jgi:deazaflavin-dependent oxidoreductase (nitroreductase family)
MTSYDPADVKLSPAGWVADQAKLYESSDGAEGADMNGYPCLLLDYLGRKSGVWHRTVLIYARDGDDYLIVASKGGAPQHPVWFLSLVEHPEVHVRVLGERFTARAEVLSGPQRDGGWALAVDVYPPYEEYQTKTDRQLPVIRLSRV